ncbi:phytochrome-like protein cph2 [Lysinibacillus contaminans]|uniref:Phytochrome-like protein cph2 n=1 Tax=Lysinibacillus contaminans TaxID=1293441 RepID=A0ABR5JWN3_9BACI|nr:EAL domain-containing protein [Lysinibacillus contaminans]KOS66570.1 phytochrome-like protein cph2 [Lysinibacillus contaminans]
MMQQITQRNDYLLASIYRLGENSKKSYVVFDVKANHSILHCNDSFCELTNFSATKLKGMDYFSLLSNEGQTTDVDTIKEKLDCGTMIQAKLHHNSHNRPPFWAEIQALPFQNEECETEYVLLLVKDVTYYHTEEFLTRLGKAMFEAIEKDNSLEKKMRIICNGLDEFFLPNVSSMVLTRGDTSQLQVFTSNANLDKIPTVCDRTNFYITVMQANEFIIAEDLTTVDIPDAHKEYAILTEKQSGWFMPIRNQQQHCIGLFAIFYNAYPSSRDFFVGLFHKIAALVALAHTYEKTQKQILDLAYTDITTGLPNRHSFLNILDKFESQGREGFIKIIKPSEFHQIVELYGREAGDELLRQIARRFVENKNERNEYIARFTSSSLIISRTISRENMMYYDARIRDLIQKPFIIGDKQIYITLKTGIAPFSKDIKVADAIRFADSALSYACKKPGTRTEIFTKERNDQLEQQMTVLNHLSYALKNREISVNLQPKVDLKTGEIQSIEALARWISPTLGFVSPEVFIPVAENAGKVREIDLQILELVLQWLSQRKSSGKTLVKVAVNISPDHFYHPYFVKSVVELLRKYDIDPNYIILEVTENIGLVDFQTALTIIRELNNYGFETSVDDFGIGFSSLSYLQKLPFAELKIDRSFINGIHDAGTLAIVRSIIQLALNLGMTSVAEGIESEEQVEILRTLGCKIGQGYYYYKPMSIEQLNDILDA